MDIQTDNKWAHTKMTEQERKSEEEKYLYI